MKKEYWPEQNAAVLRGFGLIKEPVGDELIPHQVVEVEGNRKYHIFDEETNMTIFVSARKKDEVTVHRLLGATPIITIDGPSDVITVTGRENSIVRVNHTAHEVTTFGAQMFVPFSEKLFVHRPPLPTMRRRIPPITKKIYGE